MAPAEALDFFRKRESELREKWLTEIGKPYDENNYHQIEKLEQSLDDVRFACGELHWILGDEAQAENFWNQTLKKYKPFIYLHRSRRYEKRGDSKWAVTWCYTFSCDAGTLLYLEKHWRLFQLYRRQNEGAEAADNLRMVLEVHPEYKHANETAYEYWMAQGNVAEAIGLCADEYLRTRAIDWADRAIRWWSENRNVGEWMPFRKLLKVLFDDNRFDRWEQAACAIYSAVDVDELDSFAAYLKETIMPILKRADVVAKLAGLTQLLIDFCARCDGDKSLRERHAADFALMLCIFGNVLKQRGAVYEGAVRLKVALEEADLRDERWAMAEKVLSRFQDDDAPDPMADEYPWVRMAKELADTTAANGLDPDGFRRLLRWERRPEFRLMMIGTFNNGKSSLINALLGQKLLKTKALPTTSTLVFIAAGEQATAALFHPDSEDAQEVPLEQAQRLTAFDAEQKAGTEMLTKIELPNEWLSARRAVIIDTPGFNDFSNLFRLIFPHIDAADRVVMIIDATHPVTGKEADTIRELLSLPGFSPERLAFVLNKSDLVDPDELADVTGYVRDALNGLIEREPPLFVFSSKRASEAEPLKQYLDGLMPASLSSYRFERFAKQLADAISRTERLMQERMDGLRRKIERFKAVKQRLESVLQDVRKEQAVFEQALDTEHDALREEIKQFLCSRIPELLRQETGLVYIGSDYKTLRQQVDSRLKEIVRSWAHEHVTPLLQEKLAILLERAEKLHGSMRVAVEGRIAGRLDTLREVGELDEQTKIRIEPVRWQDVSQAVSELAQQFVNGQTYDIWILGTSGFFAGLMRGIVSFFSGSDKVLEDVRQELRMEMLQKGEQVARRLHWKIFDDYSSFSSELSQTALKTSEQLAETLEKDIGLADQFIKDLSNSLKRMKRQQQKLDDLFANYRHQLKLWDCQVRRGVIVDRGELRRLA
jgi:GTPase Era involved in 16S rRNA processing